MQGHSEVVISHVFGGSLRHPVCVDEARSDETEHARLERVRSECHATLVRLSADLAGMEARPSIVQAPVSSASAKLQALLGMDEALRNPLHSVLGYAQMLRLEGGLTHQQSKWVTAILTAGKHLLERVHDTVGLAATPDHGAWHIDDEQENVARQTITVAAPAIPIATVRSSGQPHVLHVLVVDDIAMNCEIASAFIRAAGHTVLAVESGAHAVTAASAADFDVILMDLKMPEMDGMAATRRIRALEGRRGRVPIVAVTAMRFQRDIEACRAAGMNGHLAKPFRYETLNEAVRLGAAAHLDRTSPRQECADPAWIDISSPWTEAAPADSPETAGAAEQYVVDTQFKLKLVAVGKEHRRRLVDRKRSCAPLLDRPQHEFHWLLYTDESGADAKSYTARCDLWRWSHATWWNISVPGAKFSPDEMYDHGWRYCGPCIEKTAIVHVE